MNIFDYIENQEYYNEEYRMKGGMPSFDETHEGILRK